MCRYVIKHCPSPFVASGWEVGCGDYFNANYGNVITGQNLRNLDTTHILRRSYEYHFVTRGETNDISRHSNDQCALHYAIRGERNNYLAFNNGKIILSEDGTCYWDNSINLYQGFIQKNRDKDSIATEIESLMMMDVQKIDFIPPSQPKNITFDQTANKLKWDKSFDKSQSSWVVGYNIYIQDNYLRTVYGNQFLIDKNIPKEATIIIKALNSSGIESEPNSFKLK